MTAHRLPESECPSCGYRVDAASGISTDEAPKPGDVTLCMKCGQVMQFTATLGVRGVQPASIPGIDRATMRNIRRAQRAIAILKGN